MDIVFIVELLLLAVVLFVLIKTLLESIKVVFYVLLVVMLQVVHDSHELQERR